MKYVAYLIGTTITVMTTKSFGFILALLLGVIVGSLLATIFQNKPNGISQENKSDSMDLPPYSDKEEKVKELMRLGAQYESGNGVERNYLLAIESYSEAAKYGNPNAQFKLGMLFSQGHGGESNQTSAVDWYLRAARQGHSKAQLALGWEYKLGLLTPKDEELGEQWLKRAYDSIIRDANNGNAEAQFEMAQYYATSYVDGEKERYWCAKSAEQGYAPAQFNLARLSEDKIERYKWLLLATENSDHHLIDEFITAPPSLKHKMWWNTLKDDMSENEISAARNAANDWAEKHNM